MFRLHIITERRFPESDWEDYKRAMREIGSPITEKQWAELYETGSLTIDHRNVDNAVSVYILKREEG